eukprot:Phypoly_transcript_16161.p1 GENE.Phypoly_transcript_16161~~Phypoly_transcript_16161.p1  ORF type:complete len:182 (+),score=21.25 Phypoly_transcript_16161:252-797(+)
MTENVYVDYNQFLGGNERWRVRTINKPGFGLCVDATSSDKSKLVLQEIFQSTSIKIKKIQKDILVLAYPRRVSLIHLYDGASYDFTHDETITVVSHTIKSQTIFAGTLHGKIVVWKYKYEKLQNANNVQYSFRQIHKYHLNAHESEVTYLLLAEDCSDGVPRLVSGAKDGSVIIWKRRERV